MASDLEQGSSPNMQWRNRIVPSHHVLREIGLEYLLVPATMGALLAAAQAGISAFMPWEYALLYWFGVSFGTWLVLHLVTHICTLLIGRYRPPLWLLLLLGAFLTSLLIRPAFFWFTELFQPVLLNGRVVREMPPFEFEVSFLLNYLKQWSGVFMLWIVVNYGAVHLLGLCRFGYGRKPASLKTDEASQSHASQTPFQDRIPSDLGKEVIALKAEDHYIRVYTPLGDTLVLYRFSDAIKELSPSSGLRVHRSFWINTGFVQSVDTSKRTPVITMSNGLEIPVSQTYKEAAKLVLEG